jgi:hypothetical protein
MSGGRIYARRSESSAAPAARLADSRPWPARTATPAPARDLAADQPPAPHFDFRKIPLRRAAPSPPLQAKLEIGAVNDPLEREADAVADRVMRTADASPSANVQDGASAEVVQRKCTECEDEEKLQRKADGSTTSAATPGTADGNRLLAHELAHVVQQTGASSRDVGVLRRDAATPGCTATFAKATTYRDLISLLRAAEAKLVAAGVTSVDDQIKTLRGIYYGTSGARISKSRRARRAMPDFSSSRARVRHDRSTFDPGLRPL